MLFEKVWLMGQKLPHSDYRDIQIAQLKAELERAYQIIDHLRWEKTHFQKVRTDTFQNGDRRLETPLNQRGSHTPLQRNPDSRLKNRSPHPLVKKKVRKRRQPVPQSSVSQLSYLLFVTIVTAITAGLILFVAGGIIRSKPAPVSDPTPTPSVSQIPQASNPPARPAWAIAESLPAPSRQLDRDISEIAYNLQTPPELIYSQQMQTIVDEVVAFAAAHRFPKKSLSITLIDPKTGETAGYQQHELIYPASVVKMFWMVVLYAQIEGGFWASEQDFYPYIAKMIEESNNDAASFILDEITRTESLPELKSEELDKWVNKRLQLSRFFQQAGYQNIIVSQKTFPIYYLKANEPIGNDSRLQKILQQQNKPFRNLITTEHAARLMYEICYTGQAVSKAASQKMCGWLKRDLNPAVWDKPAQEGLEFNPVRSFFGESLTNTGAQLYSKAGWTSHARHEVALVTTPDGRTVYILAIFGADKAYAQDGKIFPKMSHLVYDRMTARTLSATPL